eukprot:11226980-Alexandrium_andersonii.AAC.1
MRGWAPLLSAHGVFGARRLLRLRGHRVCGTRRHVAVVHASAPRFGVCVGGSHKRAALRRSRAWRGSLR